MYNIPRPRVVPRERGERRKEEENLKEAVNVSILKFFYFFKRNFYIDSEQVNNAFV